MANDFGSNAVMSEESKQSLLSDLNPPQQEAVEHFEGPILVLAGAGSGKTRVLTRRVANLVLSHGVRPQNILAVTFTNKATEEMRHRLRSLLGEGAEDLWVATFHSAALRMLRKHASRLGYTNDFVVYDTQDTKGVLKGILKELNIDEKRFPLQLFSHVIDQAKNAFVLPEQFAGDSASKYTSQLQAEVYSAYQNALIKANAMDFGDLLVNAVRLLQIPEILSFYRHFLHFILVDEYQDTNAVQYMFIRAIAAPRNNLLVVGDDDQSIYAFRGASIRNILEFEKDLPNAKVVKLEQNYRSTGNILNAAHAVIEKNKGRKEKKLWTSADDGAPIVTYVAFDETDEAAFIAREIAKNLPKVKSYNNIAIFYRTNAQSRAIEEALLNSKIPYKIFGGLKFYDRKEVKDILAYLRLLTNESDNQAYLRSINTPPRGIGPQTLQPIMDHSSQNNLSLFAATKELAGEVRSKGVQEFLALMKSFKEAAEKNSLSELIEMVIEKSEYEKKLKNSKDVTAESRIENLKELVAVGRSASFSEGSPFEILKQFLDKIALTSSGEDASSSSPEGTSTASQGTVSLMTLHLAKGLEYPMVFLTGVEEGLIPHYRSVDDPTALEEERRLCYVGITRAMSQLYISRAEKRGMFASGDDFGLYREPSRFAFDLPPGCLKHLSAEFTEKVVKSNLFEDEEDISFEPSDDEEGVREPQSKYGKKKGPQPLVYKGPGAGAPRRSAALASADNLIELKTKKKAVPANAIPANTSNLKVGAKVLHGVFGEGTVEKLVEAPESDPTKIEVIIRFNGSENSKKLVLKYAKLWVV